MLTPSFSALHGIGETALTIPAPHRTYASKVTALVSQREDMGNHKARSAGLNVRLGADDHDHDPLTDGTVLRT